MIISIQLARALAAWLVFYSHYRATFLNENDLLINSIITISGDFGVNLFFTISGYIMYHILSLKKYSPREFIIKRLFRILPAYWFATILLLVLSVIFPFIFTNTSNYEIFFILKSLFLIPDWNPSGIGLYPYLSVGWTLEIEVFFYFCIFLSLLLLPKYYFIFLSLLFIVLPLVIEPTHYENPYFYILSSSRLYYFIIGIFIAYIYRYQNIILRLSDREEVFLIASLCVASYFIGSHTYLGGYSQFISIGLLLYSIVLLDKKIKNIKLLSFPVFLGKISFSTYLLHGIVLMFFEKMHAMYLVDFNRLEIFILIVLTLFVSSYLSYRYIENAKILSNIKEKLLKKTI